MPLWTVKDAAAWLNISERKVARLMLDGSIPSFLLPPPSRQRRARSEDVERWALSRAKDEAASEEVAA